MYCNKCDENIGYLCYSTYDRLELKYKCNCGNQGSALLDFEDSNIGKNCINELIIIKNRFCCPKDNEPLFTELAEKYNKTNAQIVLKWHIQNGNIIIPGSKNPEHMKDNANIFDFELSLEEMKKLQN